MGLRDPQPRTFVDVVGEFVREEDACKETIVGNIRQRDQELEYVGDEDIAENPDARCELK
jgi:hypothetical protein